MTRARGPAPLCTNWDEITRGGRKVLGAPILIPTKGFLMSLRGRVNKNTT